MFEKSLFPYSMFRFTEPAVLRIALSEYVRREGFSRDYVPMPGEPFYYFAGGWHEVKSWRDLRKRRVNLFKYRNLQGKEVLLEVPTSKLEPIKFSLYVELIADGEIDEMLEAYRKRKEAIELMRELGIQIDF